LTDDHEPLAKRAASSLASLNAHDALSDALDNSEVVDPVKMQIAQSLAGDSEPAARLPGLKYLAKNLTGREARQNIRAMQSLDAEGARTAIEAFLTHDQDRMRRTAAEVLQARGSLDSLDAMATAIDEVENAEVIADAGYSLLVDKPTSTILNYTEASNPALQRMAYRALGTRAAREGGGSADVFQTLKQGASSSDPRIRGAAARGLGAIGGDQALGVLESMTDDSKSEVRRDVALALGDYDEGVLKSTLLEYLDDDSPKVVAAAITTFEKRGATHIWKKLQTLADSQNPGVKAASLSAMAALVPRDDNEKVSMVISRLSGALSSSQNDDVVLTALESLGSFPNGKAVQSIAIQLNAQKTEYRAAAVRALAATGQPGASDLIVDVLNDKSSEVRLAAVRALQELKAVQAVSALKDQLDKETNKEIRGAIESTLKQL
jgi:HEAT repeat protein